MENESRWAAVEVSQQVNRLNVAEHQVIAPQSVRASIIIVNYNGKEKLLACLNSVRQSVQADCEVIIVDNASFDTDFEVIETNFPEVTLLRCEKNVGYGAGNNAGARKARGKYLVFLNPDTLVTEGWIEAMLAPFEANQQAGLVTAKVLLVEPKERINACGNAIHLTGLTLCRGLMCSRDMLNEPEEVDAVSGAAFAIRREVFEALDGFDEDTFLYMEDTDISLRARLAGWRCLYAPDSVVLHDYSLRITAPKVFYQERNRYLMLLKSFRWPTLAVLLPAYLLAELITWGFVLLKDWNNIANKPRAYRWVIDNWPATMQKRRQAQSLRRVSDRELLRHTTFRLNFHQAANGGIVSLASIVFNPIFFVLRSLALAVVWW